MIGEIRVYANESARVELKVVKFTYKLTYKVRERPQFIPGNVKYFKGILLMLLLITFDPLYHAS